MKYEDLPRKDRLALHWYIGCLKEKKTDIDYKVYESPSLFIIYLDDDVFDDLEDNIDEILDSEYTSSQCPTIDKGILFAPKKFMASYEEKIEDWVDVVSCKEIEIPKSEHKSNALNFYCNQNIQQGVLNECSKAA